MPSSTIAAGFPLAYQIAGKVIDGGGRNDFLRGSEFHFGVRKEYMTTDTGVVKKKLQKVKNNKK